MSVIVISMVLVVVGFVTLMLGVLGVGDDPLQFVYVSIGACLVAAVFLVIGVVRGRPSKKPVAASGGEGGDASWSGASAWGDKDAEDSTSAISRDEEAAAPASSGGTPRIEVVTAEDVAGDERATGTDDGFQPPDDDEDDDEPVVVPKRTAAERAASSGSSALDGPSDDEDDVDVETAEDATAGSGTSARKSTTRKSTAKKASAKKAATKKSTAKKATAKKAAAKKSTAKKATAKKSTAKKSTAKKAAPKSAAASSASDASRLEDALGNVSGVGPAKRKALLAHFGSFDALADATPAQLQEVSGVSETLAERIRRALR